MLIQLPEHIRKNATEPKIWIRGFFMLIYAMIYNLAQCAIMGIVFFQFGATVLTGKPHHRLTVFGESLSIYIAQILNYLFYSTEKKPFPLSSWPKLVEKKDSEALELTEPEPPIKN